MMFIDEPESDSISQWLERWKETPLSYGHRGGVDAPPMSGFVADVHRMPLGKGEETFQRACAALDDWRMFPEWTQVEPSGVAQQRGQIVAMIVRILGIWWVNPCRILGRVDGVLHGERRHGFVYGTLPEHAECGEERFMVEMLRDGSVWYEIRAFSRPQHWLAFVGYPVARWWQLRFARDSMAGMQAACES